MVEWMLMKTESDTDFVKVYRLLMFMGAFVVRVISLPQFSPGITFLAWLFTMMKPFGRLTSVSRNVSLMRFKLSFFGRT